MLQYFLTPFANQLSFCNLFRYLTFCTMGAIITSLLISFLFGKSLIKKLKNIQQDGQPIREDGPANHLITKKGTPTMGGILILLSMNISVLLWGDLKNPYLWIVLFVTLGYGLLGAVDDYKKLTKRNSVGLSGKVKLLWQILIGFMGIYCVNYLSTPEMMNVLTFPIVKDFTINLGGWFYIWGLIVVVGSSNAVNLTDGLDGLAVVPTIIAAMCFCIITYLVGNSIFSQYLQIHYVADVGDLCVLLGGLIGSGLGFLWFNAPPAKIFMGDTGSLALGGALGMVSLIVKHEIVLSVIGGLFVFEAVSVMLQIGYYKLTKKRIFLMAPIHHHFEKKGWAESTIVIRFWIIAAILAIIGLSSLKIR